VRSRNPARRERSLEQTIRANPCAASLAVERRHDRAVGGEAPGNRKGGVRQRSARFDREREEIRSGLIADREKVLEALRDEEGHPPNPTLEQGVGASGGGDAKIDRRGDRVGRLRRGDRQRKPRGRTARIDLDKPRSIVLPRLRNRVEFDLAALGRSDDPSGSFRVGDEGVLEHHRRRGGFDPQPPSSRGRSLAGLEHASKPAAAQHLDASSRSIRGDREAIREGAARVDGDPPGRRKTGRGRRIGARIVGIAHRRSVPPASSDSCPISTIVPTRDADLQGAISTYASTLAPPRSSP
jgi:hypothetical protein